MRLGSEESSYEYICTHIDEFMIVSMMPERIMEEIQRVYAVKSIGTPEYYIGNDYRQDKHGRWMVGFKKYLNQAISRVELIFGLLRPHTNLLETGDHPEMGESGLLGDDDHGKYQMLFGMLV
jgi:hypothetical protein